MMSKRSFVFWPLLGLFVVLGVWWITYARFDVETLYRCLPANAMFITEHDNLAGHWRDLAASPPARSLMRAYGDPEPGEEAIDLADQVGIDRLLRRFAQRRTVFAYVSAAGSTGQPAWVAASWIGGWRSLWLRAMLSARLVSGFRRGESGQPYRCWIYDVDDDARDIGVSLVDGVLVAWYSATPSDVVFSVLRVHRRAPLAPALLARLKTADASGTRSTGPADRGWVSWYGLDGGVYRRRHAAFTLDRCDATGTDIQITGLPALFGLAESDAAVSAGRLDGDQLSSELGRLLGEAPTALVSAPWASVVAWMEANHGVGTHLDPLKPLIEELVAADTPVALALLGGDYSRRLFVRVPTLVFALRTRPGVDVASIMSRLIDDLNARYGRGLIPCQASSRGQSVVVVDTTRGGYYSLLEPEQRAAYAIRDGWLLLASNMDALGALLAEAETRPALAGAAWQPGGGALAAHVWADLPRTRAGLSQVLAAWTIALLAQGGDGLARGRARADEIRFWLDVLEPLNECRLDVREQAGVLTARVSVSGQADTHPRPAAEGAAYSH